MDLKSEPGNCSKISQTVSTREVERRKEGREGRRKREKKEEERAEREGKKRERERTKDQAGLNVSAKHRGTLWIHHQGAHISGP